MFLNVSNFLKSCLRNCIRIDLSLFFLKFPATLQVDFLSLSRPLLLENKFSIQPTFLH